MTTEALKTTAITNMDAVPPVRATAGKDGPGRRVAILGSVVPTNGYLTGSTYRFARVPSNVRNLRLEAEYTGTITTFTGDITLYYSELASDEVGIGQGDTGVVNSLSTTNALFAHALALGSQTANAIVDVTNQNGKYGPDVRGKELWDAAGLTSDPGGFFDIVFVETSTISVSGAVLGMTVSYSAPYL